jgi:hypothetical protein
MFERDKAIETLIGDDLDSINQGYVDGIWYTLAEGFKGYNNFTDEELMEELQERDISILFGEVDDE